MLKWFSFIIVLIALWRYRQTTDDCFKDDENRQCCTIHGAKHCWPGIIIVGAKKAGSTLLSTYMEQHPDIHHAAQKELHYFGHTPKNKTDYLLKFKPSVPRQVNVECTPAYMTSPSTAAEIAETPAKLVIILRNPIDRAYSEYWMAYQINEQSRPSLDWLQENLLAITKCLGVVNNIDVHIPEVMKSFPAFLKYLSMAKNTQSKYKSDTCLMFFPKEEMYWQHIIHVRERFRHFGLETYHCLEKYKNATRCQLGMLKTFPPFEPNGERWIKDSEYYPQIKQVLRHHPNTLILFYEDLISNPRKTTSRIFEFAGLSPFNVTKRTKKETSADIDRFFPEFVRNSGWTTVPRPKLKNRKKFRKHFVPFNKQLSSIITLPKKWYKK